MLGCGKKYDASKEQHPVHVRGSPAGGMTCGGQRHTDSEACNRACDALEVRGSFAERSAGIAGKA